MSNPAETLYWHFHHIAQMDPNVESWKTAWANRLGRTPWADAVEPLLGLLRRTERIVLSHPDMASGAILHHKPEWHRAILMNDVNMQARINQSGFSLTEASNYSLYTVAMLIKVLPETAPDAGTAQLSELSTTVGLLHDQIVAADDLENDLRTFLLGYVAKMRDRLDKTHISGSGPVEELIQETIGSGAANPSLWQRAMDSSVRDKILAVFVAFQAIVGAVDTTTATIESAATHVNGATVMIERIFADAPKQIEPPRDRPAITSGSNPGDEPVHEAGDSSAHESSTEVATEIDDHADIDGEEQQRPEG